VYGGMQKNFSKINIKSKKNLILFADSNGKFSIIGGVYTSPPPTHLPTFAVPGYQGSFSAYSKEVLGASFKCDSNKLPNVAFNQQDLVIVKRVNPIHM